jgi:HPt (histidine-containing phosphotransfer) domain-containing protein
MSDQQNQSNASPIDYASALERIGGDEDFLNELLELYSTEFSNYFEKLQDAIQNSDYQSIRDISHTLKGSSANLSLIKLQEISYQIECAGQDKDINKAKDAILMLGKEFQKLKDYLDSR